MARKKNDLDIDLIKKASRLLKSKTLNSKQLLDYRLHKKVKPNQSDYKSMLMKEMNNGVLI